MEENKYNDEGCLIITETDECPFWEKTKQPCLLGFTKDCFYCRYSDFRTPEYIRKAEDKPKNGKWFSVCHNEKNMKK